MARNPPFWVLVRNYRWSNTKLLVQSPHVDLKAQVSRIIIRAIDGEHMGEPRVVDDVTLLRDDIDGRIYHHAAHGVCISLESYADSFPVWVCLERNERHQENHVWVLNLYNYKFVVVPIAKICWVPSHQATNGQLLTIIGDPGRHGYQGTYLPAISQNLGLPKQAKLRFLPTDLLGYEKLEPRRQQELFDHQYLNMNRGPGNYPRLGHPNLYGLRRLQQPSAIINEGSELPDFCQDDFSECNEGIISPPLQNQARYIQQPVPEAGAIGLPQVFVEESVTHMLQGFCRCHCPFPDLGPTCLDPYPLHKHITDCQCSLGSKHPDHCIFAAHRPEHCVISSSIRAQGHKHCVTGGNYWTISEPPSTGVEHRAADGNTSPNHTVAVEAEMEPDDHGDDDSVYDGLGPLPSQPFSLDDQAIQSWSHLDASVPYSETRQNSPDVQFFPDTQDDRGIFDILDPICGNTAHHGSEWAQPIIDPHGLIDTPEPQEMHV
ncbi:hypothetical protein GQX73_g10856 [Xylaria multiplex]|uniref:Uncharacterized protein n=1 Tax=Xylaria multiplex TaxID=323545 RepID=A0A7C8IS92_9PEZI|nr:hypothetical protein GQX73_g10856 [Xylaria multiplex]